MKNLKTISLAIGCAFFFLTSSCKKEHPITFNIPEGSFSKAAINKSFMNITYGQNYDFRGRLQMLKMDIYLPEAKSQTSTTIKYPVLLFVHGGGFQVGDKSQTASFAKKMNEKGFAVATINYRLGWSAIPASKCDNSLLKADEAVYRAMQDTRASLRFITANAKKYQLNTNLIFAGGSSAGAVSALNAYYYSDASAAKNFPGMQKKLGPIDAGNSLKNNYDI